MDLGNQILHFIIVYVPMVFIGIASEFEGQLVMVVSFRIKISSDILTNHETVFDIIVSNVAISIGMIVSSHFYIRTIGFAILLLSLATPELLISGTGVRFSPSPCIFS